MFAFIVICHTPVHMLFNSEHTGFVNKVCNFLTCSFSPAYCSKDQRPIHNFASSPGVVVTLHLAYTLYDEWTCAESFVLRPSCCLSRFMIVTCLSRFITVTCLSRFITVTCLSQFITVTCLSRFITVTCLNQFITVTYWNQPNKEMVVMHPTSDDVQLKLTSLSLCRHTFYIQHLLYN